MSLRLFTAFTLVVALASLGTPAEARIDNGPIASKYELNDGPVTKPNVAKNFRISKPKTYASTAKAGKKRYVRSKRGSAHSNVSLASRAMNAGSGDGGASRSCLQSSARALLDRIESQFGPVQIVSTCRPGAVIRTTGKPSKHRYGLAIDFNAGSRKGEIVRWLVANHTSGGTMTYAGMNHIHVDIGYRFVSLNSGGGKARRARA